MEVRGNGVVIVDGDTTPDVADYTDFGNYAGVAIVRTFLVHNTGTTPLALNGNPVVAISGTHAAEFVVISMPNTSIPAGGSSSFQIGFAPTGTGIRTATVSIANDDPDENPYDFAIQGNAGEPEIEVRGNSVVIVDGDTTPDAADHTDFGNYAGVAIVRTFLVYNVGTRPLNLTGNPLVALSGANAADFAVTSMPSSSIEQGNFASFQVTFAPVAGSTGIRTATITIANDDTDENPYDFAIQANAGEPEIEVRGNNVIIVDGDTTPDAADHTDFGNFTGSAIVRTFVIYNLGPRPLNLTGSPLVVLGGANPADFAVTSMPNSSIAQGGSSSFQVTFSPVAGSIGIRAATISIANDDADENPYDFAIQANAGEPEIEIRGNNVIIVDGDTTPSAADHTDFGNYAGTAIVRTFLIYNLGQRPLNLTGNPLVRPEWSQCR